MNHFNVKNIILYWFPKIVAILLGVFFIIFGEYDDSPGAQGLGLIIIITMIIWVIRKIRIIK